MNREKLSGTRYGFDLLYHWRRSQLHFSGEYSLLLSIHMLTHCWLHVGLASQTVDQHGIYIGYNNRYTACDKTISKHRIPHFYKSFLQRWTDLPHEKCPAVSINTILNYFQPVTQNEAQHLCRYEDVQFKIHVVYLSRIQMKRGRT